MYIIGINKDSTITVGLYSNLHDNISSYIPAYLLTVQVSHSFFFSISYSVFEEFIFYFFQRTTEFILIISTFVICSIIEYRW